MTEKEIMRRLFLFYILLLALSSGLEAQTKLSLKLNHIVQSNKAKTISGPKKVQGKTLSLFRRPKNLLAVEENPEAPVQVIAILADGASLPTTELANLNIHVLNETGKFITMNVPVKSLESLDKLPEFKSIAENRILKLNNNNSRTAMQVTTAQDPTQAVQAGLKRTYTGKGVVVGVFDCGIDFNHNNFRDPETKQTRIKKGIIYNGYDVYDSQKPSIYTDPEDIDKMTTDCTKQSHGTHTSSTAAGSYTGSYVNANGDVTYTGIQGTAYNADLVLAGTENLYNTCQMHALKEMDATAEELNEPLVVNLSLGSNGDWLDGKNELCEFYDEFTGNGDKPGRIICMSAGNEGGTNCCIKTTLNSTNNYTVSSFIPSPGKVNGIDVYSPNIYFYGDDATEFTVQLDVYTQSDFSYVQSYSSEQLENWKVLSYGHHTDHDGRYAAVMEFDGWHIEEDINYYYAVTVKSQKDCTVRLFAFNLDAKTNTYSPCDLESKGRSGFTPGNDEYTINDNVCTNSVLCVGAYVSHNTFNSYNGNYGYHYPGVGDDGQIASFSSYVTKDDNGVQRPDFCAPGVSVVSGYNSYDTNVWPFESAKDVQVCGKATEEYLAGHTSICGVMCGTSMSCPNATGVIALLLEKNPNLTVNKIRELIRLTADNDEYTAEAPYRFGYGKLNALKALLDVEEEHALYNKKYDLDGDGKLSVSDITTLVNYILGK